MPSQANLESKHVRCTRGHYHQFVVRRHGKPGRGRRRFGARGSREAAAKIVGQLLLTVEIRNRQPRTIGAQRVEMILRSGQPQQRSRAGSAGPHRDALE